MGIIVIHPMRNIHRYSLPMFIILFWVSGLNPLNIVQNIGSEIIIYIPPIIKVQRIILREGGSAKFYK